ncbi:adenosylcobinamide amidohydrolase [Paracoccus caeni]|uniref:Adenosylcobinamide amidohydrolase n=1 Tax=Paracoccus caeni TaxID=657651 RepID=A0A934SCU1_9RHOB|nr:adenosylcobinamide amidohydrolase [Paracoccus caeni]MBK4214974.1 adenosylcobinamide amidohydrolase [Paracoccus caeni]
MRVNCKGVWLSADLGQPRQILSFAPWRPGFVTARRIAIRQVRDADLGPGVDVQDWLSGQVRQAGYADDVVMLTSRGLQHHRRAEAGLVSCLATVGLGNAERIGHRRRPQGNGSYGTINILLLAEAGLSRPAMIEAMTLIASARTAAVIDAGLNLPSGAATGTGTDCIALACAAGAMDHVGMHTELGEAIGRAVYQAVLAGARDWISTHGNSLPGDPQRP